MFKLNLIRKTLESIITKQLNLFYKNLLLMGIKNPLILNLTVMNNVMTLIKNKANLIIWWLKSLRNKNKSLNSNNFQILKLFTPRQFKSSFSSIRNLLLTTTIKDGFGCNFPGFA